MLPVMMLCTTNLSIMYLLPVCGASKRAFYSQVACLLWSGIVYYWITYDNKMSFAPIITPKRLFSLIYQSSNCSSDSMLTWKASVIMASPFLFCSFLDNSLSYAASIYAINVTSFCVLEKYVGLSSLSLSLAQNINDVNRF